MTFYDLAIQFMIWGHQILPHQVLNFQKYLSEMLKRDRVLVVTGDNGMECILCFFLTNNTEKFANRPMWSTPEDEDKGEIMFIDKMVSRRWTPPLRRLVQDQIESKFPNVKGAVWLREPQNRNVIIRRRAQNVHSKIS